MDSATLINENPTVLSASQLPTRQSRAVPRNGPDCRYSSDISAPPSYMSPPFCDRDLDSTPVAGSEPIDEQEIYDLISNITDPEHPISLGQLSVINLPDIHIDPSPSLATPANPSSIVHVTVELTPTVTHCSLATVLGLGVRVRLEQVLPPNYRVRVVCKENSHTQDDQVNKQLGDKERVAAALENDSLMNVLNKMLASC